MCYQPSIVALSPKKVKHFCDLGPKQRSDSFLLVGTFSSKLTSQDCRSQPYLSTAAGLLACRIALVFAVLVVSTCRCPAGSTAATFLTDPVTTLRTTRGTISRGLTRFAQATTSRWFPACTIPTTKATGQALVVGVTGCSCLTRTWAGACFQVAAQIFFATQLRLAVAVFFA